MVLVPQIESFVIFGRFNFASFIRLVRVKSDLNENVCGEQMLRLLILDAGLI